MKKIRTLLWTVGVVLGAVLIFLILFEVFSHKDTKIELITDNNRLIIPIEIEGKTYKFLWDTGAGYSLIDYKLAKNLSYKDEFSYYSETSTLYEVISDTVYMRKMDFKIGDINTDAYFALDGVNRYLIPPRDPSIYTSFYDKEDFIGVIGQNIISKYNWVFDFPQKTVRVSNRTITDLPLKEDDDCFQMNYYMDSPNTIPRVDLQINKSKTFKFTFDTGINGLAITKNEADSIVLNPIFTFSKTLNSYHTESAKYAYGTMSLENGKGFLHLLDTMRVNDLELNTLSSVYDTSFIKYENTNYITASFARMFRVMYYNPSSKEIKFYVSPQDSIHENRNIDERMLINKYIRSKM